jgi:glutamyl-tRNA reductase
MILSTCNRVEILVAACGTDVPEYLFSCWAAARGERPDALAPYAYMHTGSQAVRHLFTVAASLDSMVLGEPQILGQLKDAYRASLDKHQAKVILNRLLHKAFSVAKRVRTETGVASSAVSISYAAVELAKRIFDDMGSIQAMLIGAGEMAELAATNLVNAGIAAIRVTNRTHERAVQLAALYKGDAIPFEERYKHLVDVDIVISSTGSHEPIIHAHEMRNVMRKRKNRPMFFIDIAVPRDVDPEVNSLDNIYLYDIDDLKEVVEENMAHRREEAERALDIVMEETTAFCRWLASLELQPTLVDILNRGKRIAEEELERTAKRLGPLSEEQRRALSAMGASIVKKLNHDPLTFLKRHFGDEETNILYVSLARRMFNLDREELFPDAHFGRLCPGVQSCLRSGCAVCSEKKEP